MAHSPEDLANDRATWRQLRFAIGGMIGFVVIIVGWVAYLSHALDGKL